MQGFTKIALIPSFEPADNLLNLVVLLSDAHFQVVLVDDGSGENYRRIFSASKRFAEVLIHETNKGKGAALKTGLAFIKRHYPEDSIVVCMDADGQHSVEDAIKVAQAAANDRNSYVLGSRSFCGEVPKRSRFGNRVTRFAFKTVTGADVSDTQTGLRAFSASLIPFLLSIGGQRYEYEMNVLLKCASKKIPIKEVEIATIYFDNNEGSHFNSIKDSFRIYREIIKFSMSSLTGFAVDYGFYSLMVALTAAMSSSVSVPLSNISARIVSSGANYAINRNFVFKNKDNVAKTALKYFTLAACILVGNTLLLSFMVNGLGINAYTAKIFTEIVFFTASWLVQKIFIFSKKPNRDKSPELAKME